MLKITDEQMNIISLEKTKILRQADRDVQEHFLKVSGLKVGDRVYCRFSISTGTSKQAFISSTIAPGVIKLIDDQIHVYSEDKFKNAHWQSNGKYGRAKREYWHFSEEIKKSDLMSIKGIIEEGDDEGRTARNL